MISPLCPNTDCCTEANRQIHAIGDHILPRNAKEWFVRRQEEMARVHWHPPEMHSEHTTPRSLNWIQDIQHQRGFKVFRSDGTDQRIPSTQEHSDNSGQKISGTQLSADSPDQILQIRGNPTGQSTQTAQILKIREHPAREHSYSSDQILQTDSQKHLDGSDQILLITGYTATKPV